MSDLRPTADLLRQGAPYAQISLPERMLCFVHLPFKPNAIMMPSFSRHATKDCVLTEMKALVCPESSGGVCFQTLFCNDLFLKST